MSVFARAGDGMEAIGTGWRFCGRIVFSIFRGSVFQYFGEALRQAGVLITGLLDVYAILFGISGGILAELLYGQPLGGFFATLFNNASVTDLWGSILKCTIFGAIIGVVCCYKGMNASGGAAGVGRAVNQAVVISFMGVFAFNYAFTQTMLATNPELQTIR